MGKQPILIAIFAIIQFALQNNTVEYLSEDGYSSAVILLFSSLVMLTISMINCIRKGLSPFPLNWRVQRIRMVCSGVALYLGTLSYHYIHATTASFIFQLNVPFIIILSAFSSRQLDRRVVLSAGIVGLALLFFGFNPYEREPGIGILIAFLSVALLALSYIQAKKSVGVENQYVIINITCISCIAIALLSLSFTEQNGLHYNPVDIGMLLGVGFLRYGQSLCLIALLKIYSTDRAQFPFLLGALATMFLEMWLENHLFPISYIVAILVLTVTVAGIVSMTDPAPIISSKNPT